MPTLRLGSIAPDFEADTTDGPIKFHQWAGTSWVMLFSHPGDFTPVCTTELADISHRLPEFVSRNVKVIGLSTDNVQSHNEWIEDIIEIGNKTAPTCVEYPIIADPDRDISRLYDMLDEQDETNVDEEGLPYTIRTIFIIDPLKKIRAMLHYPASVGRDFDEVMRIIDALLTTDKHQVMTPSNWKKGDDVVIHPSLSNEEARKLFPSYTTQLPYLRTTSLNGQ
ncbi:hypothetical protein QCA50_011341 [Cerrena zonata]|uniref:Thioredoxin domain-containing protein n=1 Tax=Cerrena zonata TaxID=2478898 RepID=A0AAW0FZE3_9APHY